MSGLYVCLEGIDGCGKSTIHKLLKEEFKEAEFVREPGTTKFAEDIRSVIFNHFNELNPMTIQIAMLAARSDMRIPKDKLIISDRCFLSAAYCEEMRLPYDIRRWLSFSFNYINKPNLIIVFDITAQTSVSRLGARSEKNGYDSDNLALINERINSYKTWISVVRDMCPNIDIVTVDANSPIEEVLDETITIIKEKIKCQECQM